MSLTGPNFWALRNQKMCSHRTSCFYHIDLSTWRTWSAHWPVFDVGFFSNRNFYLPIYLKITKKIRYDKFCYEKKLWAAQLKALQEYFPFPTRAYYSVSFRLTSMRSLIGNWLISRTNFNEPALKLRSNWHKWALIHAFFNLVFRDPFSWSYNLDSAPQFSDM